MNNQKYNGELDAFETPTNLWANIEAALDAKENKKAPFLWWKATGILVIVLGTSAFFVWNSLLPQDNLLAKNEPKTVQKSTKEKVEPLVNPAKGTKNNQDTSQTNPAVLEIQPIESVNWSVSNVNLTVNPPLTYAWTGASTTLTSTNSLCFTSPLTYSISMNSASTGSYGFTTGSQLFGVITPNTGKFPTGTGKVNRSQLTVSQGADRDRGGEGYIADTVRLDLEETESNSTYDEFAENDYLKTQTEPLSTFSIDVDGASYSDVRGMINRGEKPNLNSVRIEEFVNYFPYQYAEPQGEHPFSIHSEVSNCPWNTEHQLLKIGIKGKSIDKQQLPTNNLVFLMDVSGSMSSPEKLDLLKQGFKLLIKEMREEDKVSICVYAGAAGVVLPPTSGANKDLIWDALNNLEAGGSTAGGQGIELAYKLAEENFDKNGNNRVILATDGDFNVGVSDDDALVKLIEEKRKTGVFLTVLGFGHDNFQSSKMEKLANNGNGNFSFIDNILEAKKVLVTEMGATLQTIAKDVKIQIEFNPELVSAYRLIGYENRLLENEDFNNDTIDAGELGAGHTVTALYEIIPAQVETPESKVQNEELKYSKVGYNSKKKYTDELATVKFRYKEPNGSVSQLLETTVSATSKNPSEDFAFIQAVVEFGLILRESKYAGTANLEAVLSRALAAKGEDPFGYRGEFILLVEKAKKILVVE